MTGPATATAFNKFSYTVTITNTGDVTIFSGVIITDTLPAGTSLDDQLSGVGGSGSFYCSASEQDVTCTPRNLLEALFLNPGEQTNFPIGVIQASANCTPLSNIATLTDSQDGIVLTSSPPVVTTLVGCNAPYTVTPSADPNVSISPSTPQVVTAGNTFSFTITPNTSYDASVAGTCGGRLVGNIYTTLPVAGDCTVIAMSYPRIYTITPGIGRHATISPDTPMVVSVVNTPTFTITADPGFSPAWGGDCSGSIVSIDGQTIVVEESYTTTNCSLIGTGLPSIKLTSSANPVVYGQSVTLTATLSENNPPGVVNFQGGYILSPLFSCVAPVVNVTATCVVPSANIDVFGDPFSATYTESHINGVTGDSLFLTTMAATTTTLAALNSTAAGKAVMLSASISSNLPTNIATPSGTITITDTTDALSCSYALRSPQTGCSIAPLGVGTKTLTAKYSGDNYFLASSDVETLAVTAANSATSLTSSPNPATIGRNITLHASVSGYAPSGTVGFSDGATTLCSANLSGTGNSRIASCDFATLVLGSHSITASYSGDSNNAPSMSAPLVQVVNEAPPPLNLDQHGLTGVWYNPATSGQGLLVETYPDLFGSGHGYLAAGWYTFDLTAAGGQRWYTVQGDAINGSVSVPLTIYTSTGGNFNAPPAISAAAVGTATLSFSDCTHGTLAYHFTDGRPDGSIPLTRLDTNITCTSSGDSANATANYLLSGAWYDSTHTTSGQGFFFDFSPALTTLFGAWYTYSPNGASIGGGASQRWYTIQDNAFIPGTLSKNGLPIYETKGGTFNTAGGASAGSPVGTANIVINSCTSMMLNYTFTAGTNVGLSGAVNLTRVVAAPAGCNL